MARKTTPTSPRRPRPSSRRKPGMAATVFRKVAKVLGWTVLGVLATIALLRWVPPPTSAFMLIRHVERIFEHPDPGPAILYFWTPREKIPAHVALAMVAAEDQNFPSHRGFDLDAIVRAMEHNKKGNRVRGASTISQQVAKNLFLWSGRSFVRKGLEAGLTVVIETLWPKERILEVYLNIAEFGDGTYGVGAAAKRFYNKTPDQLTRREAALLAAVLPSPKTLSAQKPSAYVQRRAAWVQTQSGQLGPGHITWP